VTWRTKWTGRVAGNPGGAATHRHSHCHSPALSRTAPLPSAPLTPRALTCLCTLSACTHLTPATAPTPSSSWRRRRRGVAMAARHNAHGRKRRRALSWCAAVWFQLRSAGIAAATAATLWCCSEWRRRRNNAYGRRLRVCVTLALVADSCPLSAVRIAWYAMRRI